MPNGLVQQHARPACAQHHVHLTGGRGARFEVDQGRLYRFVHILLQQGVVKIVQPQAATAAAGANFTPRLAFNHLLGNDCQAHPHHRAHIGCQRAVQPHHQHHIVFGAQPRHDLHNARVFGARHFFDLFQQRDFGRTVQRADGVEGRIQAAAGRHTRTRRRWRLRLFLPPHAHAATLAAAANAAHLVGGIHQGGPGNIVGIGKGCFFARNGAQAHALVNAEAAGFDNAFFQAPAFAVRALKIQVRIIHATRMHDGQRLLQMAARQAEGLEQQGFGQRQPLAGACHRRRGLVRHKRRSNRRSGGRTGRRNGQRSIHARIVKVTALLAVALLRVGFNPSCLRPSRATAPDQSSLQNKSLSCCTLHFCHQAT